MRSSGGIVSCANLARDGRTLRHTGNNAETGARHCFSEYGDLFVHGPNGLQRLDARSLAVAPPLLKGNVEQVVRSSDGTLVAAVQDGGLFTISGDRAVRFSPSASAWLKGKSVTGGCQLTGGRLALSTRHHGVIIIGPRGAIIKELVEETGAQIDVDEEAGRGVVKIYANSKDVAQDALDRVNAIANPVMPEKGERYNAHVVKTVDFGAFVSLTPGTDGLLHISELSKMVGRRLDHAEEADGAAGPGAGSDATLDVTATEEVRSNLDGYEPGVLWAVGVGADTDTNAAVTGALLGCRLGTDSIPAGWLAALKEREPRWAALRARVASRTTTDPSLPDVRPDTAGDGDQPTPVGVAPGGSRAPQSRVPRKRGKKKRRRR